ncbi:MAG: Rieske 2Fe-2S domain-containing protein [Nitrososphaerales archaeon]|nr:Rieske 2Fe-2S domain-containing protein [Nitrososphaerales archaeon]
MEEFRRAVASSKLPPGSMLSVEVDGETVLLANIDGTYYGMGGICTHAEWDLSEGSLEGARVTCAGHGSVWELATGRAEFDEQLADEPLYDVKEEDGFLLVRRR